MSIYSSLLNIIVSKQRLCIFDYTNPSCEEIILGAVRVLLLAAFLAIAFGVFCSFSRIVFIGICCSCQVLERD